MWNKSIGYVLATPRAAGANCQKLRVSVVNKWTYK
jgi:hypothetical protein